MNLSDKSSAVSAICQALLEGANDRATAIIQRDYPFVSEPITKRRFSVGEYTKVFVRDGFTDRYTGERLVFPPVLRVISFTLPDCFPYHSNWKTDATHPAYWQMSATLDHQIPVSRGGLDEASNWITTSMARNSAKGNWTLGELGWKLYPPGEIQEWDGMLRWFLEYTARHPDSLVDAAARQWRQAAEMVGIPL